MGQPRAWPCGALWDRRRVPLPAIPGKAHELHEVASSVVGGFPGVEIWKSDYLAYHPGFQILRISVSHVIGTPRMQGARKQTEEDAFSRKVLKKPG